MRIPTPTTSMNGLSLVKKRQTIYYSGIQTKVSGKVTTQATLQAGICHQIWRLVPVFQEAVQVAGDVVKKNPAAVTALLGGVVVAGVICPYMAGGMIGSAAMLTDSTQR